MCIFCKFAELLFLFHISFLLFYRGAIVSSWMIRNSQFQLTESTWSAQRMLLRSSTRWGWLPAIHYHVWIRFESFLQLNHPTEKFFVFFCWLYFDFILCSGQISWSLAPGKDQLYTGGHSNSCYSQRGGKERSPGKIVSSWQVFATCISSWSCTSFILYSYQLDSNAQ